MSNHVKQPSRFDELSHPCVSPVKKPSAVGDLTNPVYNSPADEKVFQTFSCHSRADLPAGRQAGIQDIQRLLDTRFRGYDSNSCRRETFSAAC
jgi:hypothetical protein